MIKDLMIHAKYEKMNFMKEIFYKFFIFYLVNKDKYPNSTLNKLFENYNLKFFIFHEKTIKNFVKIINLITLNKVFNLYNSKLTESYFESIRNIIEKNIKTNFFKKLTQNEKCFVSPNKKFDIILFKINNEKNLLEIDIKINEFLESCLYFRDEKNILLDYWKKFRLKHSKEIKNFIRSKRKDGHIYYIDIFEYILIIMSQFINIKYSDDIKNNLDYFVMKTRGIVDFESIMKKFNETINEEIEKFIQIENIKQELSQNEFITL